MFSTNLQIHIVTYCIHLHIHHTSRTPYLFQFLRLRRLCGDDSDFSEKLEAMYQFFDKRGDPVSVVQAGHHRAQQIDPQSALQTAEKEHTDRIPFTPTFHPHNHAVNLSFLKTLIYSKTIQRLALSFLNPHLFHSNITKTQATFWSEVHFKPVTNLELSNALAHDAKFVLSFITQIEYRDPRDPLRSLITLRVPPPMLFTA